MGAESSRQRDQENLWLVLLAYSQIKAIELYGYMFRQAQMTVPVSIKALAATELNCRLAGLENANLDLMMPVHYLRAVRTDPLSFHT